MNDSASGIYQEALDKLERWDLERQKNCFAVS